MRWVKLTFAPVTRARCRLSIERLASRSLAGTWRTLVAVGTSIDAAMLVAMRAAAPRSGVGTGSSLPLAEVAVVVGDAPRADGGAGGRGEVSVVAVAAAGAWGGVVVGAPAAPVTTAVGT